MAALRLGVWAAALSAAEGALLPIFFMHGLNGKADWFDPMQSWIREIDPDVRMYSFPIFEEKESLRNLWLQSHRLVEAMRAKVAEEPAVYEDGYSLVCHSQGAALCRVALQLMDDHRVHTLVALAGPQRGVYGLPDNLQSYLPWARSEVYHFAYTSLFQANLSLANLWHDPRTSSWPFHPVQAYHAGNAFLPAVNNDPDRQWQGPGVPRNDTEAQRYRQNLLRLKQAVFTCSDGDDQVLPHESGIFSFYEGSVSQGIVPLEQSRMWSEDWLGLRELFEGGRLVRKDVSGICHDCWARDQNVFNDHIVQHLPVKEVVSTTGAFIMA